MRLDATANERDARRTERLAEDGRPESVRLDDDLLALGLERAARDEQRRADVAAPLLELFQRRSRLAAGALP